MIAYHVDRSCFLTTNQIIKLSSDIKLDNVFNIYKNSLSQHGINMFNNRYNWEIWELCLELIRINYFPQFPSRFQCFFGAKTLENAIFWKGYFANQLRTKINICKIEFSSCFEFDSNWLSNIPYEIDSTNYVFNSNSLAYILQKSYKYWNQEKTENPIFELLIPCPVKVLEVLN